MRTLVAIIVLSLTSTAFAQDANLIWPMLKVRSGVKPVRGQDAFKVKVSVDNGNMRLSNGSRTIEMDGDSFRRAKSLSDAVLTVEAGHDRGTDTDTVAFGTAFHVGGNYIMTNRHVLSPRQTNWTRCNGLKVKSPAGKSYDCHQVVYCEPTPVCVRNKGMEDETAFESHMKETSTCPRTQDMCLIEVKTNRRHPFAAIPSVMLDSTRPEASTTAAFSTVGNSANYGLHFSESRSLRMVSDWRVGVRTQAFPGNSGGPLFNEQNEVIGIVYSRNNNIETFAVSMEWTLNRLKEKLGESHPAWQAILPNIR